MNNNVATLDPLSHISTSDLIEILYKRSLKVSDRPEAITHNDRITLIKTSQNYEAHMLECLMGKSG